MTGLSRFHGLAGLFSTGSWPISPDGQGGRQTYPVPFNLTSLETAFGPAEGARLGEKLIAAYGAEKKVTILELRQARDRRSPPWRIMCMSTSLFTTP